jgi:glycosyltransferase involved in cell wall biosynthesis
MTASPRTCSLVTGSLQPYALDFYRALDRSLQKHGWRLRVIVGSRTTYRPWSGMGVDENDPLFSFIGGKPAPEWIQKTLGSSSRDKILLPAGRELTHKLEELGTTLLIVNERNPLNIGAALWARTQGIPCALSTDIGQDPQPHAATRLHLVYHRLIAGLFDGVIGKTPDGESTFAKAGAIPPILAPHGIDTNRFPVAPPSRLGRFRFLFVGVLQELKGLDALMTAARLLHAQGHRFEIRLVGTGPWAPSPEDVASPWLSMAGFVEGSALLEEYHAANAFILPTKGDTYGVVVHEAASCGLPLLVGMAAGACQTLVEDEKSGYRLDPSDPVSIASKMALLLEDPELAPILGRRARELAEQWCTLRSGERVADWVLELYAREKKSAPAA